MKIKDANFFKTIRGFLTVYLPKQKCASPNTIKSYRETLNLLLKFLEEKKKIQLHKASFSDLGHKTVGDFLEWIENSRKCSVSTRNQRLMAIKSFFKYAVLVDATQMSFQMGVQKVPIKKSFSAVVEYLSHEGLKSLLSQPNAKNDRGLRDQVLMTLMYDAALRCQEILDIKVRDVDLNPASPSVLITGKGRKMRSVPITAKVAEHIKLYLKKFHPQQTGHQDDYLFYTMLHQERKQMSCDNVARFIKQYGICIAVPMAQILPDLAFLQGIEKLGIIGILAAGILFFVRERRSFIAKSGERLESVEKRLHLLETQVINGNDKVVYLLDRQLATLDEIKNGQT